jgi:hypothetical protein
MTTKKCPNTEKKDCILCGPWLGWIDLKNPGRGPTYEQWSKCCAKMQEKHNALYQHEFESLELVP